MQHTDKAIAEFEAWWIRQSFHEQFEDVKDQMRNVWVASWDESRAQIVIELPDAFDTYERGGSKYWADDVAEAIEAAGVTVRG
jgi:hypothetical protein